MITVVKNFPKFKEIVLIFILCFSSVFLAGVNYSPVTWLSGWDTLHPEFNINLYLQRIFWGVWQQHQGLGAVAAQAHASELGRLWYLLPASLLLPESLFRYGYFWLMLVLGPLGIFFLLRKFANPSAAFLGGLLYLLNLGTLQHFYLPLEMFGTAYGVLPWLFWAVVTKRTVWLAILFLASAPMAHTPTLWLVNFSAVVLFSLFYNWRWGIKVAVVGLMVNSFWLLPSLYFIWGHSADVVNSHISQQFSYRAADSSKAFSSLWDAALLRGYLFDWGHFDFEKREYVQLLDIWKEHLNNPVVLGIGYGVFASVVAGIFLTIKRRRRILFAFVPVFVLGMVALLELVPLTGKVFGEALRFPFTKFSFILMISYVVFFGMTVDLVIRFLKRWRFGRALFMGLVSLLLGFYMLPAFKGELVCQCERVNFPSEYRRVFSWFRNQDSETRMALFPMDSIYGWKYYGWGYEGAGFLWFGLGQGLLDREFDRWMGANENYYWEMANAIYAKNLALFENVLGKYRVSWLMLDENVINPQSSKALFYDELKEMLNKSGKFKLERKFGKISIYSVRLEAPVEKFVSVVSGLSEIGPKYKWGNLDKAFVDFGDYFSTKKPSFEDSSGARTGSRPGLVSTNSSGSSDVRGSHLSSRESISQIGEIVNVGCGPEGNCTPETSLDRWVSHSAGPTPQVSIAEIYYPYRTLFTGKRQEDLEFNPSSLRSSGQAQAMVFEVNRKCEDGSGKTTECATVNLPDLTHAQGYLISVESRNISGQPLAFWIENWNSRRSDLETYLPKRKADSGKRLEKSYFVLPPMELDGLGYSLHFDNASVGNERVENEVGEVAITAIDYWSLVSKKEGKVEPSRASYLSVSNFEVSHPNPSFYQVDINSKISKDTTLILSQSFENGWLAIGVKENGQFSIIDKHVLVSNWANGWKLSGDERIVYLFFWPQLLEFAGFGMLGVLGFGIVIAWGKRKI